MTANELTAADKADLDRAFTYHAPKDQQPIKYQILRDCARDLAIEIIRLCPDQDERQIALHYLDLTVMCANAAIARYE